MFGVLWGAWQAALPDLARHYDLSSGPLGVILTAGFALSLPAMLGAGRLLDRLGAGWGIGLTAVVMAVGLALVGVLPSLPVLVLGVVLMAAGSGAYDVAINGAAMGRRVVEPAGAPDAAARGLQRRRGRGRRGGRGAARHGDRLPGGVSRGSGRAARRRRAGRVVRAGRHVARTWASRAGCALADAAARRCWPGLAFLAEGSMETWSAIYLRDDLGAAAFVGALGPAAFHAAMLAGRLIGPRVAGRLGAASTLHGGRDDDGRRHGASRCWCRPRPSRSPAWRSAALGASFVVPVVVSMAAGRAGPNAGRAASYVLTLGYAGFLVGPSLVGILGELSACASPWPSFRSPPS